LPHLLPALYNRNGGLLIFFRLHTPGTKKEEDRLPICTKRQSKVPLRIRATAYEKMGAVSGTNCYPSLVVRVGPKKYQQNEYENFVDQEY